MSNSGIKIEVHLIQNFAPSNLNRDDTGQPKSSYFGGFRRARISSQCGKRATRQWWREHSTIIVGDRTKRLQRLIADRLDQDRDFKKKILDEEDLKTGIRVFTDAYYAAADGKEPQKTTVLTFIGPDEVNVCAKVVKEIWDDQGSIEGIAPIVKKVRDFDAKKASKKKTSADSGAKKKGGAALKKAKEIEQRLKAAKLSADIALFGRMLAEQPGRNTDGACQVAHPISTHKVNMEMDFYTAVDDLNPDEETGAGMMGVVGFNSACFYRYALVDRDQLARNLARKTGRKSGEWIETLDAKDYEETDSVIKAFLEAMVYAIPTGKQNSFAAQNLPSFGLFVRRQGGVPVSLANAFAKPVRTTRDDDDLVGLSITALTKHWDAQEKVYGKQGVEKTACFHLGKYDRLNGLKSSDKGSVENAINDIMEATARQ